MQNDVHSIYRTIFNTDDPLRLINQLREAKAFLSKINHKEYNNVYVHLSSITNYSFRVDITSTPPKVIARLRVPKATQEEVVISHPVPSHLNSDIEDVLGAIDYMIAHKNIEEFIFPAFHMHVDSMNPLNRWCEKNSYTISLFEDGIVIRKK